MPTLSCTATVLDELDEWRTNSHGLDMKSIIFDSQAVMGPGNILQSLLVFVCLVYLLDIYSGQISALLRLTHMHITI